LFFQTDLFPSSLLLADSLLFRSLGQGAGSKAGSPQSYKTFEKLPILSGQLNSPQAAAQPKKRGRKSKTILYQLFLFLLFFLFFQKDNQQQQQTDDNFKVKSFCSFYQQQGIFFSLFRFFFCFFFFVSIRLGNRGHSVSPHNLVAFFFCCFNLFLFVRFHVI
jgi:hypothetical protein